MRYTQWDSITVGHEGKSRDKVLQPGTFVLYKLGGAWYAPGKFTVQHTNVC